MPNAVTDELLGAFGPVTRPGLPIHMELVEWKLLSDEQTRRYERRVKEKRLYKDAQEKLYLYACDPDDEKWQVFQEALNALMFFRLTHEWDYKGE